MFGSITNYFYDRRRGFAKAAGFVGGAYLVGRYVVDRLAEIRERVMQERAARDNVRKRFQQNIQDISFTIMSQLPILGQNILSEMNVEALTAELQSITRASRANTQPQPSPPPPLISPSPQEQAHSSPDPQTSTPSLILTSTYPPNPYAQPLAQSPTSPLIPPSDSSLSSSLEFIVPAPSSDISSGTGIAVDPVPRSTDNDTFSLLSHSQSARMEGSTSQLGASWVDQFSEQQSVSSSSQANSHTGSRRASEDNVLVPPAISPAQPSANVETGKTSGSGNGLAESISSSGMSSQEPSIFGSSHLEQPIPTPQVSMSDSTRSKAELWREVKMLTMTRTLTTLYSTTLLSLFTHIQLSLLGRYKYVRSILELEADERAREGLEYDTDISSLFFQSGEEKGAKREKEEEMGMGNSAWARFGRIEVEHADADDDYGFPPSGARRKAKAKAADYWIDEPISDETERMYLMLSWWILNVGWKDVGERVRRGVEEAFEGVSLKSKLGVLELNRLVGDVRRRVEWEVTFEGRERRINFLSTLLPPTSSALSHLLARTGFSSYSSPSSSTSPFLPPAPAPAPEQNPTFNALLSETRDLLSSPDFLLVLERCLDRGTEVLLEGLRRNVFSSSVSAPSTNQDTTPCAGSGSVPEQDEEPRMRLAGMLPGLARWSALAVNTVPNELVDNLADVREVEGFAAIIYSSYEDRFR